MTKLQYEIPHPRLQNSNEYIIREFTYPLSASDETSVANDLVFLKSLQSRFVLSSSTRVNKHNMVYEECWAQNLSVEAQMRHDINLKTDNISTKDSFAYISGANNKLLQYPRDTLKVLKLRVEKLENVQSRKKLDLSVMNVELEQQAPVKTLSVSISDTTPADLIQMLRTLFERAMTFFKPAAEIDLSESVVGRQLNGLSPSESP